MKHLIATQEFMERAEHFALPNNDCQFQPPLPEKITPIELNQTSSSPPTTSPPLTIKNLREQIQLLHKASVAKKLEWISRADFFFNKLKALEKLEKMSKLGEDYLTAYLLTKSAHYADYQAKHLKHTNFDLPSYLQTLASEIATEAQFISPKKEVAQ